MTLFRHAVFAAALITTTNSIASADGSFGVQTFVFTGRNILTEIAPDLTHILAKLSGTTERKLMVKIWYPAQSDSLSRPPHHYGYHTEDIDFAFDPTSYEEVLPVLRKNLVTSRTVADAEPAAITARPVLFYSHGSGAAVETNDAYFEYLVSRGYIVVSIGHTYNTSIVTLDDGVVVRQSAEVLAYTDRELPSQVQNPDLAFTEEKALALAKVPVGIRPPDDLLASYHYVLSEVSFGARNNLELWIKDTQFVLAQLESMSEGQIGRNLGELFDFERIGAIGYSFGGPTARHFCDREPRCRASINIDGTDFSEQNEAIWKPHLRFLHDPDGRIAQFQRENPGSDVDWDDLREQAFHAFAHEKHALISRAENDLIILTLADISHPDYTLGWVDLHSFGRGKAVWHSALEETSAAFLDAQLQPTIPVSENRSLCSLTAPTDIVQLDYRNVCD